MTYNAKECANAFGNTGAQKFCGPVGKFRGLILVPKGTTIATETLALTVGTWTDNINGAIALRWFPTLKIVEGETTQDDPVFQEFDFGFDDFVQDGKRSSVFTFEQMTVYNENQLNFLNDGSWDVYLWTDKENIVGNSREGVLFEPMQLDYIKFLPSNDDSGSEVGHVTVTMKFTDVKDFSRYRVVINPTTDELAPTVWYPSIEFGNGGIKDLIATASSPTATGCTLVLKDYNGTPYSGADGVPGDAYLALASDPDTLIAVTSITETATAGTYTLVWASQSADDYLVGLVDQPDATTQGFETPVKAAITIV